METTTATMRWNRIGTAKNKNGAGWEVSGRASAAWEVGSARAAGWLGYIPYPGTE